MFHIITDVLLINMSTKKKLTCDRNSKDGKVSLFYISSDATTVCQSLVLSFNVPDVAPMFWNMTNPPLAATGLELANRNRVLTYVSPIFRAQWRVEVNKRTR